MRSFIYRPATYLVLLAALLAGCNWVRLLEFRGQLKRLPEYARWEDRPWGRTLVFVKPVLNLGDLRSLGLSPLPLSDQLVTIKYRYRIAGTAVEGSTEMIFLLNDGKVGGVCFPSILVDMVGPANIDAFLRMAGGDSSPEAKVGDVGKARLLRTVFGSKIPPINDSRIQIVLTPQDEVNSEVKLEFEEKRKPGLYSSMSLVVARQKKPAGDARELR